MDNRTQSAEGKAQCVQPETHNNIVRSLAEELGIPDLAARLLYSRGISDPDDAHRLLYPKLEHLSDPLLLPDIEQGVTRTIEAIQKNEKICLYGDYDADGVTSVALLVNYFRHIEVIPEVYIPERHEGYGLNIAAVKRFHEQGTSLLICLDCGSSNIEEVEEAGKYGIDVVIIDHHEPPGTLPSPIALINPKRADSRFPTRELAACGVAFFFLLALRRAMTHRGLLKQHINLKKELDLVTVGSIGDMVPLVNDNRVMVKFGMETMQKRPRTWLRAFFSERVIYRSTVDEYTLNFVIVPRINAAGRVSDPRRALAFLTSEDDRSASSILAELNETNRRRQKIEEDIVREIIDSLANEDLDTRKSIVLFNENWHLGVIGIVAQKVVERFGKPSIILTRVGDYLKGSGRGGDGIDLYDTVASLSSFLLKYGGHKYACGIALAEENLVPFVKAFEKSIQSPITPRDRGHRVDAQAGFEELTLELIEFIEQLSPFGMGNPRPNLLFPPSFVSSNDRFVKVTDTNNKTWRGSIQGQCAIPQNGPVRIVATPIRREHRGEQFVHLNIKNILSAENPI
jgi:single-stranded-DNA-specific exonuclease